ncbi:MAG: hypothetical protein ALMCE001_03830 [Methanocorpusculum sp. MCE]|nr:MAG: hypothetical protein ALMCE001_03830 [Methanocorpusculum sp. MCE]
MTDFTDIYSKTSAEVINHPVFQSAVRFILEVGSQIYDMFAVPLERYKIRVGNHCSVWSRVPHIGPVDAVCRVAGKTQGHACCPLIHQIWELGFSILQERIRNLWRQC